MDAALFDFMYKGARIIESGYNNTMKYKRRQLIKRREEIANFEERGRRRKEESKREDR